MSNYGTSNKISPSGIKFIIKNITSAKISVLNIKLGPGNQYDLFTSPDISEDDIKTSLLKGDLKNRLERNEITILDSTLNLIILDPVFSSFLISKGMPSSNISVSSQLSAGQAGGVATLDSTSRLPSSQLTSYYPTNLAALSAFTNPSIPVLAEVQSNLGYYLFDPNASMTSDGVSIVSPPSGTGKWIRQSWGHDTWRYQATWYVDPTSGSDEATGVDSSHAIKTFKELAARLGGIIIQPMTVNLLNNPPTTDPLNQLALTSVWNTIVSSSTQPFIKVVGQMITSRSGTVTTAAVPVPASNLASQIQDTSVVSWTADVGKMVVITSGTANGAVAWILKDIGSNTARLSRWYKGDYSAVSVAPSPGDTYNVVTLTQVPNSFVPSLTGASSGTLVAVTMQNLQFTVNFIPPREAGYIMVLNGCKTNGLSNQGRFTSIAATLISGASNNNDSVSYLLVNSCAVLGAGNLENWEVGSSAQVNDFISQSVPTFVNNNGYVLGTNMSIYDCATALTVQNANFEIQTSLYGSGNTTGTSVNFNGKIRVIGGFTPTLTGTTELSFGGAATAIPPLTAGAAVPAASSLTTWAQWAASPFSKNVLNYTNGAAIFTG